MKNLLRENCKFCLYIIVLLIVQLGCSSADRNEVEGDADTAFNDFKNYVTSTETAVNDHTTLTQAEWDKTSADARAAYDEKVAQLDQYEGEYDEGRQEEIADLKNRYNIYWQQREAEYKAQTSAGVAGTSITSNVADDFKITEVITTSPENIRLAYENLVNRVQANQETYTQEDWKIINNYYLLLDERRDAVQNSLSDKDKFEIGKAKAKYIALRTAARFDPDVSSTSADVKNAAVSAGQQVEDKAEKIGAQVKSTTKAGAEKVENTAQKVGSEVKSTTNKVAKKIDNKTDKNFNKD